MFALPRLSACSSCCCIEAKLPSKHALRATSTTRRGGGEGAWREGVLQAGVLRALWKKVWYSKARKRRLARLRATALPTLRLAVTPSMGLDVRFGVGIGVMFNAAPLARRERLGAEAGRLWTMKQGVATARAVREACMNSALRSMRAVFGSIGTDGLLAGQWVRRERPRWRRAFKMRRPALLAMRAKKP